RIASDNVQIRDIALGGDGEGAYDVQNRTRVKLKSLFVLSNCPKPILAPAYNVVASTHVVLDHVWAAGFGDRPVGSDGIRIADSVNLPGIRVRHVISRAYDPRLL